MSSSCICMLHATCARAVKDTQLVDRERETCGQFSSICTTHLNVANCLPYYCEINSRKTRAHGSYKTPATTQHTRYGQSIIPHTDTFVMALRVRGHASASSPQSPRAAVVIVRRPVRFAAALALALLFTEFNDAPLYARERASRRQWQIQMQPSRA